jgi:hypothetical protein
VCSEVYLELCGILAKEISMGYRSIGVRIILCTHKSPKKEKKKQESQASVANKLVATLVAPSCPIHASRYLRVVSGPKEE